MANLELGDIMFNTNKQQLYNCPDWVVALLQDISRKLCNVKFNIHQTKYDSPFNNTGNVYYNDTFEVQAYNWNDDISQPYNFKWKDVEISWYKHLGRDTTINNNYDETYLIEMYNDCMQSLDKINNGFMEADSSVI